MRAERIADSGHLLRLLHRCPGKIGEMGCDNGGIVAAALELREGVVDGLDKLHHTRIILRDSGVQANCCAWPLRDLERLRQRQFCERQPDLWLHRNQRAHFVLLQRDQAIDQRFRADDFAAARLDPRNFLQRFFRYGLVLGHTQRMSLRGVRAFGIELRVERGKYRDDGLHERIGQNRQIADLGFRGGLVRGRIAMRRLQEEPNVSLLVRKKLAKEGFLAIRPLYGNRNPGGLKRAGQDL